MTSALLDGKTAVVTGAAGGIGLAIAELFYAHGASVVLADLNESGARTAAESLGERAIGLGCNVTDEDSVQTLVEETMSWAGGLDVFVNNAGVTRDASLRKMTVADFDTVIAVHLRGTWLGLRAASAVMRDAGHGSIINMSSLSGKSGNPGQTNYSAAKAGIVGMTKAGAKELAHKNVRVNAIQPGLIRTPMTEAMPSEVFAEREAAIPMKRAGEPSEVAGVALFLASDLSSYMTGTVLEVGGGRLM
ncbi:3-oxoacyl-ACP reductase FabG [Nocardia niigatensis]|uniref:3-oxoacyl-ACP reductase FabG n=1 Tax=Nocardia niigatensis TaxID=209249 RepID=UPI0005928BEA|nr:3-oxoacyl-ACP reductase FabG [Nocardia niigatensis]